MESQEERDRKRLWPTEEEKEQKERNSTPSSFETERPMEEPLDTNWKYEISSDQEGN